MNLNFSLLIVDDNPDIIEWAIKTLEGHLDTKGFLLRRECVEDLSQDGIKKLARNQGRSYDLVMVDYNLGQDDLNGAFVARQLRQELPYVDMVFYSAAPVSELLEHLAQYEVSGVFAEQREELDRALTGLADTVIGKVIDLNHMRGIVMAEVAEMDVLMEETLTRIFKSNDKRIESVRDRVIKKLERGLEKNPQRLQKLLDDGGLPAVVKDGLLFTLTHKCRTLKRLAECLPDASKEKLQIFKSYDKDIIQKRNVLAHAKGDINNDGETVLLRCKGEDQEEIIINDEWMSEFRRNLHEHMSALQTICTSLDAAFGGAGSTDETE